MIIESSDWDNLMTFRGIVMFQPDNSMELTRNVQAEILYTSSNYLFLLKIKFNSMKKLFNIIIFCLLSNIIFAQTEKIDRLPGLLYQGKYSNDQFFQKADYIIEGEAIQGETTLSKDSSVVNRQILFEITEVYKGNLSKGTVELILESGEFHLGGEQLGVTIKYNADDNMNLGGKMILFCKKSSAKRLFEKPDVDNPTTLALLDDKHSAGLYYSRDYNYNFELFGLNHLYFNTKQDFYQYLSNFKGTVLPEESGIKKKALLKSGSVDEYGQMQGYIKSLIETCNYYKANKPMLKSATAAGDIYLSVANQKVVYSASKWYYEFDVNANSGLSGTFLQNIFLELDYSKTAFGANISSGSKVTPTKLGVYNNSYYNISTWI